MKMRKLDWNSILLGIAIVLFLIIVILSTKVSAKSVDPAMTNNEQIFEVSSNNIVKEDTGPKITIQSAMSPLFVSPFVLLSQPIEQEVEEQDPQIDIYHFEKTGYALAKVNIRTEPTIESEIFDHYYYGQEVHYSDYDDNWVTVDWNGNVGYVFKLYVSEISIPYTSKSVTNDSRKSFEDYHCLSTTSSQGLMQKSAETSPSGLRKVHGRYCVALGSYFSHNIGQYIDVVLENGTVIPCIIGDAKDDRDTSADNQLGVDGSCVEFIVDTPALPAQVKQSGDCSGCKSDWSAPVVEIRLYDYIMNI